MHPPQRAPRCLQRRGFLEGEQPGVQSPVSSRSSRGAVRVAIKAASVSSCWYGDWSQSLSSGPIHVGEGGA